MQGENTLYTISHSLFFKPQEKSRKSYGETLIVIVSVWLYCNDYHFLPFLYFSTFLEKMYIPFKIRNIFVNRRKSECNLMRVRKILLRLNRKSCQSSPFQHLGLKKHPCVGSSHLKVQAIILPPPLQSWNSNNLSKY